jgi:hypothetical protein
MSQPLDDKHESPVQFRKRPVVIQAVQWTGNNLRAVIDFIGLHPSAEKWTWPEYEAVVREKGLKIFTLEGPLMASVGDWIIQGVQGECYPCKPDVFAKTYELASTPSARAEPRGETADEYLQRCGREDMIPLANVIARKRWAENRDAVSHEPATDEAQALLDRAYQFVADEQWVRDYTFFCKRKA